MLKSIWIWKETCYKRKMESSMEMFRLHVPIAIIFRSLFFCDEIYFYRLKKSHFIEFSSLFQRQLFAPYLLMPGINSYGDIRLVKRRVENHQKHSITHTSFTEKYVWWGTWWYMLESLEEVFFCSTIQTCFVMKKNFSCYDSCSLTQEHKIPFSVGS